MSVTDDVAGSVSATLERQGLIGNDPPGFGSWGITDYGRRILNLPRNTKVAPIGTPPSLLMVVPACAQGHQIHRAASWPEAALKLFADGQR